MGRITLYRELVFAMDCNDVGIKSLLMYTSSKWREEDHITVSLTLTMQLNLYLHKMFYI